MMDEFFAHSTTPVCIAGEKGDILAWNSAFEELFHGRNIAILQIQELTLDPEIPGLLKHPPFQKDIRVGHGDSRKHLQISAFPLECGPSESKRIFMLFQNPSEADRQAKTQNFSINAAAHDLANPVSAIFGYADLMLEADNGDPLTNQQKEILSRIRSTASRAIELVRNYQILSQVDHHTLQFPSGACELNKVVNDVIDYSWRDAPGTPELSVALSARPILLSVPRFAVERIFANLLSNAAKFTPPEGTVTVRSRQEGRFGELTVHNTHAVIPEEEQSIIFEKSSRGGAARDISGSGLGLYIVKNLAERTGSAVQLKSSPEDGTLFKIRFPLA